MKTWKRLTLSVLCLVLFTGIAHATILINKSLEALADESPVIVRGIVQDSRTEYDKAAKRVYTYTQVAVSEILKGNAGETIIIRRIGGVLGDKAFKVAGSPVLTQGEDVLLFLDRSKSKTAVQGPFFIKSMALGKFQIQPDPTTGKELAVRDLNNVQLMDKQSSSTTDMKKVKTTFPMAEIRTIIQKSIERQLETNKLETKKPTVTPPAKGRTLQVVE